MNTLDFSEAINTELIGTLSAFKEGLRRMRLHFLELFYIKYIFPLWFFLYFANLSKMVPVNYFSVEYETVRN